MAEEGFLRCLLANPEDTTTRHIYADWLTDRNDPRATILRQECDVPRISFVAWARELGSLSYYLDRYPELHRQEEEYQSKQSLVEDLRSLSDFASPEWLSLMDTVNRPFRPFYFWSNSGPRSYWEGQLPFREPIGSRGAVLTFESAFRTEKSWDSNLGVDLRFLCELQLGECERGAASCPIHPFIVELEIGDQALTASDVVRAMKVREFRNGWEIPLDATAIASPAGQYQDDSDDLYTDAGSSPLFRRADTPDETANSVLGRATHEALQRYVRDETLWFGRLYTHSQPRDEVGRCGWVVLFALGASACGRRLLGVISHQAR